MVKQIAPVIAADPSRQELLLTLANDANARRKAGDVIGTAAGIEALRRALVPPPSPSAVPAHDTGQSQAPARPEAGFEYDPNDPDEAELVALMQGRPGTEIQNAITDLRTRQQGQALAAQPAAKKAWRPLAQLCRRSPPRAMAWLAASR